MKQRRTDSFLLAVAMACITSAAAPLVLANDSKQEASLFDGAVPVQSLENERGGTQTNFTTTTITDEVANTNTLNGSVDHNSATNVTTGDNVISTGAFANTHGVPMVIQNSGNNVVIQNATILNVQFK